MTSMTPTSRCGARITATISSRPRSSTVRTATPRRRSTCSSANRGYVHSSSTCIPARGSRFAEPEPLACGLDGAPLHGKLRTDRGQTAFDLRLRPAEVLGDLGLVAPGLDGAGHNLDLGLSRSSRSRRRPQVRRRSFVSWWPSRSRRRIPPCSTRSRRTIAACSIASTTSSTISWASSCPPTYNGSPRAAIPGSSGSAMNAGVVRLWTIGLPNGRVVVLESPREHDRRAPRR